MLINELNGSAAETGAFMFKLAKVGPIVGKRTFGAGIGPYYFTPALIDGGQIRLPNRAAYDPSGTWGIENSGVAPDFDVEITPADVIAGRDPQLEKAVEVALAEISKNRSVGPKRPAFPVHPGAQGNAPSAAVSILSLPQAGSAYPAPAPKTVQPPAAAGVTDGKFAAFVGTYDGGTLGVLVVKQEGEKLFAFDPSGRRIELVPETAADKFTAQPIGNAVSFERDAAGKVTAILVTFPDGHVVKARKAS